MQRWDKKSHMHVQVSAPGVGSRYNHKMNGVDRVDQGVGHCSLATGRRIRKWWVRNLLGLAMRNARILYNQY